MQMWPIKPRIKLTEGFTVQKQQGSSCFHQPGSELEVGFNSGNNNRSGPVNNLSLFKRLHIRPSDLAEGD